MEPKTWGLVRTRRGSFVYTAAAFCLIWLSSPMTCDLIMHRLLRNPKFQPTLIFTIYTSTTNLFSLEVATDGNRSSRAHACCGFCCDARCIEQNANHNKSDRRCLWQLPLLFDHTLFKWIRSLLLGWSSCSREHIVVLKSITF